MTTEEKNLLLEALRTKTGTIDKIALIDEGTFYGTKTIGNTLWNEAANGKLTINGPIDFTMGYTMPIYGVAISSTNAPGGWSYEIAALWFDAKQLQEHDIYSIDGLEFVIED